MEENKKLPGETLAIVLFWLGWVFIVIPVLGYAFGLAENFVHQLTHERDPRFLIKLLSSPLNFLITSKQMLVTAMLMFVGSAFLKLMVRLVKSTEQTQVIVEQQRNKEILNQ